MRIDSRLRSSPNLQDRRRLGYRTFGFTLTPTDRRYNLTYLAASSRNAANSSPPAIAEYQTFRVTTAPRTAAGIAVHRTAPITAQMMSTDGARDSIRHTASADAPDAIANTTPPAISGSQ